MCISTPNQDSQIGCKPSGITEMEKQNHLYISAATCLLPQVKDEEEIFIVTTSEFPLWVITITTQWGLLLTELPCIKPCINHFFSYRNLVHAQYFELQNF